MNHRIIDLEAKFVSVVGGITQWKKSGGKKKILTMVVLRGWRRKIYFKFIGAI
jgi:hypothetical protein